MSPLEHFSSLPSLHLLLRCFVLACFSAHGALATGRPYPSSPPRQLDPLNNNPFQSPFQSPSQQSPLQQSPFKSSTTATSGSASGVASRSSSLSSSSAPLFATSASGASIGGGSITGGGGSFTSQTHRHKGSVNQPWIAHFPGPAPVSSVQPRKRFNYHEIVRTGGCTKQYMTRHDCRSLFYFIVSVPPLTACHLHHFP